MSKQEERDNFWINLGPASGYLGTVAEETARKNDGGVSPDGERLGWKNACDDTDSKAHSNLVGNVNDYNCPPFCFGEAADENECLCPPTNYKQGEDDDIATRYPYGDPCDASNTTCVSKMDDGCKCGDDCSCGTNGTQDADRDGCKCGDDCNCGDAPKQSTQQLPLIGDDLSNQDNSASGGVTAGYVPLFGADCSCGILPLPGMIPSNEMGVPPIPDIGPERQNTME